MKTSTMFRAGIIAAAGALTLVASVAGGGSSDDAARDAPATATAGQTGALPSSPSPEQPGTSVTSSGTTEAPSVTPATAQPQTPNYEAFLAGLGLVLGAPPVEADVTGDGRPEALLSTHTPDCGSCHARTFFVMDGANVLFSASGEGWLEPTDVPVIFEWISPVRIPGEGLCCPQWFAVESYRWDGAGFRPGDHITLRHFQEVNDMPVTATLEPQQATVVLFYSLLDRERYAQAFNVFSTAAQNHYHFEGWAAGYQDTEEIIVDMVSTVGSPDLVGVRLQATQTTTGVPATTTFEGTWRLVEENGRWLLDTADIQPLGQ